MKRDIPTDRETYKHTESNTGRQRNALTDRETYRHTKRQPDWIEKS